MKVADENVPSELREAKQIVNEQTSANGPRNKDEYAFADAAIIAIILGEPEWVNALDEFMLKAPRSSYARNVTLDVLKELGAGVKSSDGPSDSLRVRIREAVRLASLSS